MDVYTSQALSPPFPYADLDPPRGWIGGLGERSRRLWDEARLFLDVLRTGCPSFPDYLFFDLARTRSELALFTDSLSIYQHSSIVCSLLFGEEYKQVATVF